MEMPYRLAIFNSHPIQYYAPLYRRLAQDREIDLTVYYYSKRGAREYFDPGFGKRIKWDIPLLEGYRYKFLPRWGAKNKKFGFLSFINPGVMKEILCEHYDAVWLNGHAYLSDWLALGAAKLAGTAVFYRSDASLTYDSVVRRPLGVQLIKPLVLRFLFSRIDRLLSCGTLNEKLYLHYGAGKERILRVPYAVDNEYFASTTRAFRLQREKIRNSMGIGREDIVFMFAAKMILPKGPLELLQAYQRLGDLPGKALVMVGDGALRPRAEAYVRDNHLSGVHFLGFRNQSELPQYYAISDIFMRPDDVQQGDWGFTFNEAMASGLAIIATDSIGPTADLLKEGYNGKIVKFGDINGLASAMHRMIMDPEQTLAMGRRSFEMIKNWGYEQCIEGILKALRSLS